MIFFGVREEIERHRLSQEALKELAAEENERDRKLWSLWLPDARILRNEATHLAKRQEVYDILTSFLKLSFMDGVYNPIWGEAEEEDNKDVYGVTRVRCGSGNSESPVKRLWINLNYQTFQPLLRTDLTHVERLGLTYFNANTLAHEW